MSCFMIVNLILKILLEEERKRISHAHLRLGKLVLVS